MQPLSLQPQVRNLPPVARDLSLRAESWDDETRTVEVTWSTGARVARFSWAEGREFDEELDMSANAVRLDRLNAGAPVLDSHASSSLRNQIGVVVPGSARVNRGRGLATVRLSERPELAGIIADIRAGVIRNLSIGYLVHRYEVEERAGSRALWRAVDWEPLEVSFVPIPADAGAQARAADVTQPCFIVLKGADMTGSNTPIVEAQNSDAGHSGLQGRVVTAREITAAAARASLSTETVADMLDQHAASPLTYSEMMASVGRAWPAQASGAPAQRGGASVMVDEGDTRRSAMAEYLDYRLTGRATEGPGRRYLGLSMVEVLRSAAVESGQRGASNWSKLEVIERTMHVASDFPIALQQSGNRYLQDTFKQVESPIKKAMRIREVPDFRDITNLQFDGASYLEEMSEAGEVKQGTFKEAAEKHRMRTFARAFTLSRQALINDDLGVFSQFVATLAGVAAATEAEEISKLLLLGSGDGPLLADGVRLFSTAAGRANKAGTAANITVDSLGLGTAAMRKQTALDGRTPTNAQPRFILVGADREVAARQVVSQTLVPNSTSSVNPFAGELEVLVDARMTGNSWRLFADPSQFTVLELAYLEGRQGPSIEQFDTVTTLGMTFRVVHDFSPAVINWRGSFLNAGA